MKIGAFKLEFKKQMAIAIVAAFGFLIALTWRDFISEVVNYLILVFGLAGPVYFYKLVTATIVTILSVAGILVASRLNVAEEVKN